MFTKFFKAVGHYIQETLEFYARSCYPQYFYKD